MLIHAFKGLLCSVLLIMQVLEGPREFLEGPREFVEKLKWYYEGTVTVLEGLLLDGV